MFKISSILNYLKEKKWVTFFIGSTIFLFIAFKFFTENKIIETVKLEERDIIRTTRIAGKVVPNERVNLGFEIGGTVSAVNANVGDSVSRGQVLISLDSSVLSADVRRAEAELLSAEAELRKLEGGGNYEATILSAKRNIIQAMREAFIVSEDSVFNRTDQFINNPESGYPKLTGFFKGNEDLRDDVENGRVKIGYIMNEWRMLNNNLKNDSFTSEELRLTKEYLSSVIEYIGKATRAVNLFESTDFLPQGTIDSYKSDMLSARNSLNSISQKFIDAEKSYSNTLSDVPVQAARVEASRATLLNLRSQLNKVSLISPISGTISRQDGKRGQAVSAGMDLVSVISPQYKIEAFVPEVSIAGISIGNIAKVTLDAYGQENIFDAVVLRIDPAETIRDGVSTYKVELSFSKPDQRILSGMTANVSIETFRKPRVKTILNRTVIKEDSSPYVYVLRGEKDLEKRYISLGEEDTSGNVEVISGLYEVDRVVLDPYAK